MPKLSLHGASVSGASALPGGGGLLVLVAFPNVVGLSDVVEQYEGLPTDALVKELVNSMRSKRSSTKKSAEEWNGIAEEEYNRLMRKVDPWRETELESILAGSIFGLVPAYVVLLGVQQVAPKAFPIAYGGAVALVLGPLLFQIVVG